MCSRNDTEDGLATCMEARKKPEWTAECQKCSKESPVIQILQIKHAYCKPCFLTHVNHKFRSTLGKSKIMRKSDVVMSAFSGSIKSLVMLHLLHAGLSEKSHKRFLFKVKVLYIDEGAVLGLTLSQRQAHLRAVAKTVKQYGYSAHFTSLASVYDLEGLKCTPLDENSNLIVRDDLETNLKQLFEDISTLTAKEDMIKQLRKQLLLQAAKELNCGKIFTANTSTDIAIQILTDVSLGRGADMHHDVSFLDDGDTNVKILRPLLELSSKEVAFYSVYNRLDCDFIPSFCTKAAPDSSIHNLSQKFLMDLMENFPSTVSTVFRTGEKLGSAAVAVNASEEEDTSCVMCQVKLNPNVPSCSSVQATRFSRLISSLGPSGFDNNTLKSLPCPESGNSHIELSQNLESRISEETLTLMDIEEYFCYGCRLILKDMKSISSLPESIIQLVNKRRILENTRKSIEDFLL